MHRFSPPTTLWFLKQSRSQSAAACDREELGGEFQVSFREGAMGMTLVMAPESRDAIVGKIVEQGQAFRAVRHTPAREENIDALDSRSRNVVFLRNIYFCSHSVF